MRERNVLSELLKKYNLLVLLIIFIVISTLLSPNFLTISNMLNMLQQCAIPGIIAIGMTVVIILGGIDLSVGAVSALSGMVTSIMIVNEWNTLLAVLAGVIVGTVCGAVTGFLITKCKLPDFIVTLAVMEIARGAALLTTAGVPVFGIDGAFRTLGSGFIFGKIPVSGLVWIAFTVVVALMLKYTIFGRSLYAIGGNKEAATLSGIKSNRNYAFTYMISASLAGFAGVMTASWLATGQPTAGGGAELDAIAASVIGGASLSGGTGGVAGTLGGVFLLQIITNIFNLVGLESFYQQIAKGLIIIGALLINKLVIERNN